MNLIPLIDLAREFGANRHTVKAKARAGSVRIAARAKDGRLLVTEDEAARLRDLHARGLFVRSYVRVGWPDEATYNRAWYARRKAERARQAAQQQAGKAA